MDLCIIDATLKIEITNIEWLFPYTLMKIKLFCTYLRIMTLSLLFGS